MKSLLILILCLCSLTGWSQSRRDTLATELASLKENKSKLEAKATQLRVIAVEKMMLLEKAQEKFNDLLVQLDSLNGQLLKLDKIKKPGTTQQKQLASIRKVHRETKDLLLIIDEERISIQNNFESLLVELDQAVTLLHQLEGKISKLEAAREELVN